MNWTYNKYSTDAVGVQEMIALGIKPALLLTNDGQAPVMDADGNRICLVDLQSECKRGDRWKSECEQRDRNARMIAKAPEMEALLTDAILNGAIDGDKALAILKYIQEKAE